ncbi:hypothetical protein GGR13_002363 [Brevundimonas variabilis]|uniref:Uncharacterized protein n=1 Tax=Brevundimonas variabilis TaxID=74312 RepID=A0A7W9FES4_9CAUL|nr:hypothetical protein [Brevundimonas variabilis]
MSRFGSIAGSTFSAAGSARTSTRVTPLTTLTTIGGMTITGPLRAGTG